MTDVQDHGTVLKALRALLQSGDLPDGVQAAGERLLRSLAAQTRILVAGPESAGRDVLVNALCAQALPGTVLRVADSFASFDPLAADICIWCTAEFSPAEAQLWNSVPDVLKDHSFLVPVADPATAPQRLHESQLAFLEGVAAEEFYGLFPIVVTAQPDTKQADMATALLRELTVMVSWEHAAEVDNALAFIDIYSGEATQPVAALIATGPSGSMLGSDPFQANIRAGLDAIAAYARDLAPEQASADPEGLSRILTACTAAAEDLAEALQTSSPAGGVCPELAPLEEDARAAADSILLLSMEGGLVQTIAAVTTLLQMRRALEVHHAA